MLAALQLLLSSCTNDQAIDPIEKSLHPLDLTISPNPITNKESILIASPTNEDRTNLTVLWATKKGTIINSNEGFLIKWRSPLYAGKDTLTATINNGSKIVEQKFEVDVAFGCGSPIIYLNKSYNTVQIGDQCWLRDNLDVGTMIDPKQNQSNNGIIEKYCMNNNSTYCDKYGGLYLWSEAVAYNTQPGTQGICPSGWHIPTKEDFEKLKKAVLESGNSLKAIGEGEGKGLGTNFSGFSMLLAGYRSENGGLWNLKYYNAYWSSTATEDSKAIALYTDNYNDTILIKSFNILLGHSVRCLMN